MGFFYKGINLIINMQSPHDLTISQRPPPLNTITLGFRAQQMNLVGGDIQTTEGGDRTKAFSENSSILLLERTLSLQTTQLL